MASISSSPSPSRSGWPTPCRRNGKVFLVQCFGHNEELANSTNHLLVVGFYLINIGFITLTLSLGAEPTTQAEAIRFLSSKVGLAVIVLGAMHFFNMSAIAHFGRKVNELVLRPALRGRDLIARCGRGRLRSRPLL